jgi:hypothetical protein
MIFCVSTRIGIIRRRILIVYIHCRTEPRENEREKASTLLVPRQCVHIYHTYHAATAASLCGATRNELLDVAPNSCRAASQCGSEPRRRVGWVPLLAPGAAIALAAAFGILQQDVLSLSLVIVLADLE